MRLFYLAVLLMIPAIMHAQRVPADTPRVAVDSPGVTNSGVVVPHGPGSNPSGTHQQASNPPSTSGEDGSILTPLLAYNFSGGNSNLSNLTPVINYGWVKDLGTRHGVNWQFAINPYAAGQIRVKDSTNFIPALMLPGIAGINLQNFLIFNSEGSGHFLLFPLNLGIKLNTNFQDSNKIIMQHNVRVGFGFKLDGYFQLGIQHTWGWHNLTSESALAFKQAFKKDDTKISYLTVVFETFLGDPTESTDDNKGNSSSVLFAEWRCLTNKGDYTGYPNNQILTIGFRKSFNLTSIAPGKGRRTPPTP